MERILIAFMYLIGLLWVIVGALMVFATDITRRKFVNKFLEIADMRKLAPIPIVLGVLLLFAASLNRYTLIIILLGLLAITKGIVAIVAPKKVDNVIKWCKKADNKIYKIFGVVMIILGSVVLIGI